MRHFPVDSLLVLTVADAAWLGVVDLGRNPPSNQARVSRPALRPRPFDPRRAKGSFGSKPAAGSVTQGDATDESVY
jgi:hypothetical protein